MCKQENSDATFKSWEIYKIKSEGSGQSEFNAQIFFNVYNTIFTNDNKFVYISCVKSQPLVRCTHKGSNSVFFSLPLFSLESLLKKIICFKKRCLSRKGFIAQEEIFGTFEQGNKTKIYSGIPIPH